MHLGFIDGPFVPHNLITTQEGPVPLLKFQLAPRLKGKALPLQAWSGPEGSRKLRFPDFMTTAQDCGKVVSLTHRPPLFPRKCSWYSFLLEAEDFMSVKNSNDTSWDRTSDLPICSTAP